MDPERRPFVDYLPVDGGPNGLACQYGARKYEQPPFQAVILGCSLGVMKDLYNLSKPARQFNGNASPASTKRPSFVCVGVEAKERRSMLNFLHKTNYGVRAATALLG